MRAGNARLGWLLTGAVALVVSACAAPAGGDDPRVVPPLRGQAAIEAWFAAGYADAWQCEPAAHDPAAPSPHGRVRICGNPIAVADPAGVERVDASLVIQIVDASGAVVGRGAQRRTLAADDGASWYWYLHVPADSETVHDATGLAADGWGFEGPAQTYCAACHATAGAGQPGRGFVFSLPGAPAR